MSEISLILVLLFKTNKTLNDMAKLQIKSEKLTPFGGFFSISILQLSFKESIFTGFALQLLYHKNGGGGMSRVTKALKNMPEAMTLIHGYCI